MMVMVVFMLMQGIMVGNHMYMGVAYHRDPAGLHDLHSQLATASLGGFESAFIDAWLLGAVNRLGDSLAIDDKTDFDLRGVKRFEIGEAREVCSHL